jgi:translation initiation factor 1
VTVIDDLPRNPDFLSELAQSLKRSCGTGGTVKEGAIELQGDRLGAASAFLRARGFLVKGGRP